VLERIDHVTIGVADLRAGVAAYRSIGFDVDERGSAFAADDWLQLVAGREGLRSIALRGDAAAGPRAGAEWIEVVAARAIVPGRHPNGVQRIERVYIAVPDLAAAADRYARTLALPAPQIERGTVINADMAIFPLGATALGLAQPAGPGVCADALGRRGPGPFQVLYRTASMDAAAKWMADHCVPPPKRGVRNTGEQAMLVTPEYACGVYIGFVGPA
jgi:catechol 2,3-dioxygenase-like lactoylglutathione lyase family enzyme